MMTYDGDASMLLYKLLSLLCNEYGPAKVEQTVKLLTEQAREALHGAVLDDLIGRKIDRIKHVRSVLGCGLKEAKLYVEENFTSNGNGPRITVVKKGEEYRDHSLPA